MLSTQAETEELVFAGLVVFESFSRVAQPLKQSTQPKFTTSNQVGLPAELKHIIKRRKRKQQ